MRQRPLCRRASKRRGAGPCRCGSASSAVLEVRWIPLEDDPVTARRRPRLLDAAIAARVRGSRPPAGGGCRREGQGLHPSTRRATRLALLDAADDGAHGIDRARSSVAVHEVRGVRERRGVDLGAVAVDVERDVVGVVAEQAKAHVRCRRPWARPRHRGRGLPSAGTPSARRRPRRRPSRRCRSRRWSQRRWWQRLTQRWCPLPLPLPLPLDAAPVALPPVPAPSPPAPSEAGSGFTARSACQVSGSERKANQENRSSPCIPRAAPHRPVGASPPGRAEWWPRFSPRLREQDEVSQRNCTDASIFSGIEIYRLAPEDNGLEPSPSGPFRGS